MKKLKWILLFIMLLLASVFLFATCKKTKAYEVPMLSNDYYISGNESRGLSCASFVFSTDTTNSDIMLIKSGNNNSYLLYRYNKNLVLYNYATRLNDFSFDVSVFETNVYYCGIVFDYDSNKVYICVSPILFNIVNRQDESPIINSISLANNYIINELTSASFIQSYTSIQPDANITFYTSTTWSNSLVQLYTYSCYDYSQEPDEQFEFFFENNVSDKIPIRFYNYLIDTYYNQGYTAGYQKGYLEGETAGYNRGFQEGYNEGYQDGQEDTQLYQNGYRDGYTAGYNDGEMSTDAYTNGYNAGYDEGEQNGYSNGYQTGYLYGYEQGQAGENAITPAFSVISSVFGVVASVMSIQLFPGITIGLLILVPLFFAVLGLILWIWRRN